LIKRGVKIIRQVERYTDFQTVGAAHVIKVCRTVFRERLTTWEQLILQEYDIYLNLSIFLQKIRIRLIKFDNLYSPQMVAEQQREITTKS